MDHWTNIKRIDDNEARVAKFVFTNDSAVSEAVLYRYPDYKTRTVICCSTQSGCPVGCRFCGAGDYFVRSLTVDEIVSQPDHLLSLVDCDPADMGRLQIMFMSMGEPLLNLKNLVPAIRQLYAKYPKAALLISTSAPDIDYDVVNKISAEIPTIGLQFSVHETTNEARDFLVPFKKKLNLKRIAEAGANWLKVTGRKPFFNYCAHDGNETECDADRLLALYPPDIWEATISVVCERSDGLPATNEHQRGLAVSFSERMISRGYNVRVFDPAGQDTIGGGCGQLWFVQDWMEKNSDKAKKSIGYGLPELHAPRPTTGEN